IRSILTREARWAAWLRVESALAAAEAELAMIPAESADAIERACHLERLDLDRVRSDMACMSHPLMPLIVELSRAAGEPDGSWVHWGVTPQNVTESGDALVLREAHTALLHLLGDVMGELGQVAERSASMIMAGRTHGQHAV